jgi:hypothetical protein
LLTPAEVQTAATIFKLIKGSASLAVMHDFLRAKNIPITAPNWDELYTRRIEPALNDGKLTPTELRDLLRQVEECGRKHVFLYQCDADRASQMLSQQRVHAVAAENGWMELLATPLDLELPDIPKIVDIRLIPPTVNEPLASLIVKQVETRATTAYLRTNFNEDTQEMLKIYSVTKKRAVNVARLYENGQLEIRITSQDNSTKYSDNVTSFFSAISPLIARDEFREIPLSNAKRRLLDEQEDLNGEIRFGNSEVVNDFGFKMNVSSSSQEDNIFGDEGSKNGLNAFLMEGGQVSKTNLYFIIPNTEPSREVHVLLSGAKNEFAIPVSCSPEDYHHVRGKIRQFNS